jgi:hypothetical protein
VGVFVERNGFFVVFVEDGDCIIGDWCQFAIYCLGPFGQEFSIQYEE